MNAENLAIRLLIVDDDDGSREQIHEYCETLGFEVVVACNAQIGESILERHQGDFSAIIVDFLLPNFSGANFIKDAHSRYPWIPFVILSEYRRDIFDFENYKTFGINVNLVKPFSASQLEAAFEEISVPCPSQKLNT